MENIKKFPTAQMMYLSSMKHADIIQNAIDIDEKYISSLQNQGTIALILVDDAGFEVMHPGSGTDPDTLVAAKERIKENTERLEALKQDIRDLIEQNPELDSDEYEPVDYRPPGMTFNIWAEGYAATGEHGTAMLLGSVRAISFDEAVKEFARRQPEYGQSISFRFGRWDYWGCRLFDNEQAARVSFG